MVHDGLFGVTSGSPSYTDTQLTATLGQLTPFDGSPVRAGARAGCVCVCVCPSRASMAGWCIRWHVNYSAFKRGLSWIEVSGGLMTVWWSERLPLGMRGTCGYLYAYPSITQTCNLSHKWGISLDSSNDRYEMSLVLPAGNNILWFGTGNIS